MKRRADLGGLTALLTVLLTALGTTLLDLAAADPSVPVAYCASLNTASTSANYSIYQSEGLCYDFCNDEGYALGVLQTNNCWCSNYVPGDTVDTSKCESGCPGYPSDYCGGDDLYGYIKLDAAVSGTEAASSSTAATTSASTSQTIVTTSISESRDVVTVTETSPQTSVTTTLSSSSDHTTTSTTSLTSEKSTESSEKTTSSSTESTTTGDLEITSSSATTSSTTTTTSDTPSIVTSVKTVTSDGQVVYQTITSTAAASAGTGHKSLSGGAIAGIVIGILAVLGAFIAGALLYRRHKRNRENHEEAPLAGAMGGSHRRGSSVGIMSKAGTISSSGYGMPMEEDIYGTPKRMSMKPMDPRLDPKQTFGLYRAASHDSINTLRDDQDYSRRVHQPGRVLRVTNMGPTDE